jgi:hypothetical protein
MRELRLITPERLSENSAQLISVRRPSQAAFGPDGLRRPPHGKFSDSLGNLTITTARDGYRRSACREVSMVYRLGFRSNR